MKKDLHISKEVIRTTIYNRITFFPPCLSFLHRDYKKCHGQEEEKDTLWLGTEGALNTCQLRRRSFLPDAHGTLHNSSKNKCTAFGLHYRSNYQWTQRWMGAEGVTKRPEQEIQNFKAWWDFKERLILPTWKPREGHRLAKPRSVNVAHFSGRKTACRVFIDAIREEQQKEPASLPLWPHVLHIYHVLIGCNWPGMAKAGGLDWVMASC